MYKKTYCNKHHSLANVRRAQKKEVNVSKPLNLVPTCHLYGVKRVVGEGFSTTVKWLRADLYLKLTKRFYCVFSGVDEYQLDLSSMH